MKLTNTILFIALSLITGCAYFRDEDEKPDTSGYDLEQVKKDIRPITSKKLYTPTPAIRDYFDFYNLNPTNADHYFGSLESEEYTLAVHAFAPPSPIGTLILIHGYFDHTGTLANLILEGLNQGYSVIVWDLPGHGLSSGQRTNTDGFDLCARQLIDLIPRVAPVAPQPMFLIGHSTGCSIAIEYMQNTPSPQIDGYVFLAPLIRHTHWGWAKFGYAISKPFKSQVRRRDKKNSSDETYLAFVKKDPLHSGILSFEYLDELYRWEKRVYDYTPWAGRVMIVQGDQDDIVDWEYNLNFFKTYLPNAEVHMLKDARHQLANEPAAIRDPAFELIFQYLKKSQPASNY